MGEMSIVKERAMPILGEFGAALTKDGGFTIRHESARGFIAFEQHEDDAPVYIGISIPLLDDVPPSPELYRYVAVNSDNWLLGHLSVTEKDDGTCIVFFDHNILGDYLDADELRHMILATMNTANDLDDELKESFGGTRFHEDD